MVVVILLKKRGKLSPQLRFLEKWKKIIAGGAEEGILSSFGSEKWEKFIDVVLKFMDMTFAWSAVEGWSSKLIL